MPGIESFNRRRSDDSDDQRTAEQLRALYKRALTALNQYVTVKLGAGKAPVAGLLLNYIFADEVLSPEDPAVAAAAKEFTSLGSHVLAERTRELLENLPLLRRPLLSTLWVKRFIDLAHERRSVVDALDRSWVFRTYSEDYPLLTLTQYEIAVRDFEEQLGLELLDYVARAHETSSPVGDDVEDKDPLIAEPEPVIVQISRAEIASGDSAHVRRILQSWIPGLLERNRNRLRFEVTGYDGDHRELYDIPEVRAYFQHLVSAYPGLFYWIDFRSYMFVFMALMLFMPVRANGRVTVSATDMASYLAQGFAGLNAFCVEHDVSAGPTNSLLLNITATQSNA